MSLVYIVLREKTCVAIIRDFLYISSRFYISFVVLKKVPEGFNFAMAVSNHFLC